MNRSARFVLSALIVLLGAALVLGAVLLTPKQNPNGTSSGIPLIGGPFKLTAQDGRVVTDADFKGAPMLVFFGYTHCPDVCPTTLFDISQVLAKLPNAKVAALFITLDPERDTPAMMKEYLSNFDPRITGLSGDRAALDPVLKAYRVYSRKVAGTGADYTMDHSAIVYLMDKQGQFVAAFNLDRKPEDSAEQLKSYL